MMAGTRDSSGFGRFVLVVGALSLGLLITGCDKECVDEFDCESPDAGNDAGTNPGNDAGVTCAELPHDPNLGTLQVQAGFAAAESATLPEQISAVSAVQSGAGYTLYGVNGTDNSLYTLGTWPNIASSTTPLQAIIPEADRGAFPSGFLTNDGTRLLTGYTKGTTGFPGQVLVYDTAAPASSSYVSAAGNYTAAAVPGAFLINGVGIEGVAEGGAAVYALKTDARPFQGSKLASFPVSNASSGFTAVTSDNIAVLGYGVPDTSATDPYAPYINHLSAVAPAVYTSALSGRAPFELTSPNALEIYSNSDLQGVASFGNGVALHLGTYTDTREVSRIELTVGGIDPKTITAGALVPVLTTSNTCTHVVGMTSMGSDLLVGVSDKNGRRLVRLQKK